MADPGAIVAALPEERLQEWVLEQRWFASKAREVAQLNVLEAVTLREDAPALVLALVEARFQTGTHELYQLPLGLRAAGRGLGRPRDRRGRRLDGLRRARRRRPGARAAAPHPRLVRGRGRARDPALPLGGERARRLRRHGRRAAGRRRAVQLLGRVRRRADPQGVPPARAGRQPGARAAALPLAARVPAHRAARRLVRVRRPADGRDARHAAGVPQRRRATAGRCAWPTSRASSRARATSAWSRASCTPRSARSRATRTSRPRSRARRTSRC